jgi:hypothetical protein
VSKRTITHFVRNYDQENPLCSYKAPATPIVRTIIAAHVTCKKCLEKLAKGHPKP